MTVKRRFSKGQKLVDALREEINRMPGREGMPFASAAEYGVSCPTAHNAVRQLVKEGLLYRVPGSGTFLKKTVTSPRIGIADCSIAPLEKDFQQILDRHFHHAMEFFAAEGCTTTMISYQDFVKKPSVLAENFDALLVSINYMMEPDISVPILKKSGLPTVIYRYNGEMDMPFSQVYYDIRSGIRKAVESMKLSPGDSPVVIAENTPSGQLAKALYFSYLRKAGIPESDIEYHEIPLMLRNVFCFRLVRVQGEKFRNRVIFCAHDEAAFNLIHALDMEGMKPGEDYRICSIGDYESDIKLFEVGPLLSSVTRPYRKMTQAACELLLNLVREPTENIFTVKIPADFIERKSSQKIQPKKISKC